MNYGTKILAQEYYGIDWNKCSSPHPVDGVEQPGGSTSEKLPELKFWY